MLLNNYISSLWSYSSTSFFSKTCLMKQYFHNMLIGIKERNKREKYCYSETKFIRFIYFKIYLGIGKTYRNMQCFNVQCFKIMCHAYTRTTLLFCSFARCRYMCWVSTTDILFVKHCRSLNTLIYFLISSGRKRMQPNIFDHNSPSFSHVLPLPPNP